MLATHIFFITKRNFFDYKNEQIPCKVTKLFWKNSNGCVPGRNHLMIAKKADDYAKYQQIIFGQLVNYLVFGKYISPSFVLNIFSKALPIK